MRLRNQRCGPLAPLHAPMTRTAEPQSRGSSRPTRWRFAYRHSWPNTAAGRELPRTFCVPPTVLAGDDVSRRSAGWPKNPAAVAGRLRRAQTFLRVLGIEISFSREGRAGTRTIRISAGAENRATIVSAVSTVSTGCHDLSIDFGKPPQGLGRSLRA